TAVVAGKNDADVAEQVRVARLMEDRGAVMLLVEQATAELTQEIVAAVNIPVIGCGAGPACHAHVVVLHDLLGLSDRHPSFVKPVANMGQQIADAARQWADLVQSGEYLRADHPYHRKSSSS